MQFLQIILGFHNIAPYFRLKFSKYSKYLSELKSEQAMRKRDMRLTPQDYYLFLPPFNLAKLKSYILKMYKEATCEKVVYDLNGDLLPCLYRIENVRSKLMELIGIDGQIVIRNNIYQNLVPVLAGYEAEAYDTKGLIIKKTDNGYILYEVTIKTLGITVNSKEMSREEAIKIFNANEQNKDVYGLDEFFGVNRSLS